MNLSKEEANRRLEEALERIDELEEELNYKDIENQDLENNCRYLELTSKNSKEVCEELLTQMKKDCVPYLMEFETYLENYFKFYCKE